MCDIAVKVALSAQVTTARQGILGTLQTYCHLFALEPFSHFFPTCGMHPFPKEPR